MFLDKGRWALGADGFEDTPAVAKNVTVESKIGGSFNSMTYNKGASVLKTIELAVGPKIFRNALRRYLQNRSVKRKLQTFFHLKYVNYFSRKFNTAVSNDFMGGFSVRI